MSIWTAEAGGVAMRRDTRPHPTALTTYRQEAAWLSTVRTLRARPARMLALGLPAHRRAVNSSVKMPLTCHGRLDTSWRTGISSARSDAPNVEVHAQDGFIARCSAPNWRTRRYLVPAC